MMKYGVSTATTLLLLACAMPGWAEDNHLQLLERYRAEAAEPLSAERGKALWQREVDGMACTSCHTRDITQPGEVTVLFFFSKSIEPMALSANPDRYQDIEKADKAFDKNCNRVFDRDCTAQEKGDLLRYLVES
ncbi:MAG: DUF1924 domain-containing protein [Pseudomonadota bacterium]